MPHIFGNIFAVYLNTRGDGGVKQGRLLCIFFLQIEVIFFQSSKRYLRRLWSNHPYFFYWIFLWYLSTSFVKKNFNSTTRKTSRTSSRSNSIKTVPATQNFTKDKMTGSRRVDILCCFFAKSSTNVKMKSKERKSGVFGKLCFFGSLDFFYVIFCSSRFYNSFFFLVEKLNITAIYELIILIFASSFGIYLQVLSERN